MREKSIIAADAASQFLLWIAASAIPFRLLALSVPAAKINPWYLAISISLSFLAIAATTIRSLSWRSPPPLSAGMAIAGESPMSPVICGIA